MRSSVDVHNYLIERDIPHEVFAARGRFRSAERIALVLGLRPSDVCKVVMLEGEGGAVAAVVASGRLPQPERVAEAIGDGSLVTVSDQRASEITEYLTEAIPPVGLPDGIPVVVDEPLDRDAVLYFPGGEVRLVLKIRGKDLVRATGATVAPITASRRPGRRRRR